MDMIEEYKFFLKESRITFTSLNAKIILLAFKKYLQDIIYNALRKN